MAVRRDRRKGQGLAEAHGIACERGEVGKKRMEAVRLAVFGLAGALSRAACETWAAATGQTLIPPRPFGRDPRTARGQLVAHVPGNVIGENVNKPFY
jgi:hypothetical protein